MSEASAVIPAQAGIQKNKLLEGWQFLPIKDFAHTTSGGTPKRGVAKYYNGNVPWVKSGDLNDGYLNSVDEFITELGLKESSAKLFKPGTVLIALYGATIGRLSILNFEASTNQAVCGITVPESVDVKYLFYYLLSIRQKLIDQGKGGAQPNINQQIVKETVVPLAPPEQQKRIVAKIEELFSHIDAGIEALKKAKQLLKQYRQSVLKAAVTGELTKEWREANKAKLEPASQLLERINKERRQKWEEQQLEQFKAKGKMPKDDRWKEKYKDPVSLDNRDRPEGNEFVCEVNVDTLAFVTKLAGFEYTKFVKYDDAGDLAVIKAENAGPLGYKVTNYSKVKSKSVEQLTRSRVQAGDILMVFVGAGTANVAIVPDDQPYFLGPNIAMIRIESSFAIAEYLEIYLRSPIGKKTSLSFAKAVAQPSLSMGSIRMIPVLLPNIDEQKVIVEFVKEKIDSLTRLENELVIQLIKAKKNKQSILASAFSGRLIR